MKPATRTLIERWINELRCTDHRQIHHFLHVPDKERGCASGFYAVGIFVEMVREERGWPDWEPCKTPAGNEMMMYRIPGVTALGGFLIGSECGIPTEYQQKAIDMNDCGRDFLDIADALEEMLNDEPHGVGPRAP